MCLLEIGTGREVEIGEDGRDIVSSGELRCVEERPPGEKKHENRSLLPEGTDSSPLCEMMQCLHTAFTHPPVYFESSLVNFEHLIQYD
jgi:hypothetical protein